MTCMESSYIVYMYNIVYMYIKTYYTHQSSLRQLNSATEKQYAGYTNYVVFIFTQCLHCTPQLCMVIMCRLM